MRVIVAIQHQAEIIFVMGYIIGILIIHLINEDILHFHLQMIRVIELIDIQYVVLRIHIESH